MIVEVPYDLFWKLNPNRIIAFEKAYNTRINHVAWLNNLYCRQAIVSAFSKEIEYYDKPIDFNQNNKSESPNDDLNSKANRFSAWAHMFNNGFKKSQQSENSESINSNETNNSESQ